jgi:hypothetical protein
MQRVEFTRVAIPSPRGRPHRFDSQESRSLRGFFASLATQDDATKRERR